MKSIVFIFLLFAYVLSKTDYNPYARNLCHFYDIQYNTRYTVDVNKFDEKYLPENHGYYFRVSCNKKDKMQIELRVFRTAIIQFDVDVCAYTFYPDWDEIYYRRLATNCVTLSYSQKSDSTYDIYKYPFETGADHNYLSIYLNNRRALHYLDVYVYSEKGLAGGIIAVIVIVPTVVVIGIIYAICQKMGCIKKDDHYSSDDINVSPVTANYI